MHRRQVSVVVLIVIAVVSLALTTNAALPRLLRRAPEISWQTDLKAAHRASRSTGKPMMIVFTATWCGPCQKMKKDVYADAEVAKAINDQFVPVMLDIDRNPQIAEALEVEKIPQTVILNSKADLLGRMVGVQKKTVFQTQLGQSIELAKNLESTSAVVPVSNRRDIKQQRPTTRTARK